MELMASGLKDQGYINTSKEHPVNDTVFLGDSGEKLEDYVFF